MNKKGVTLVELIVVFVIIAIAATLAIPNIGGWLPRYRIRSATRDIVSTLRDAQMKAVARRLTYRVNFNAADLGAANMYVLQRNTGGAWLDDGAVQTIPSGITINKDLKDDRAEFLFDSRCDAGNGRITLLYQKGGETQAQTGISLLPSTGRIIIQ